MDAAPPCALTLVSRQRKRLYAGGAVSAGGRCQQGASLRGCDLSCAPEPLGCRRGATPRRGNNPRSPDWMRLKFRLSAQHETPSEFRFLLFFVIISQEINMPVIAWLLGVPLTVVILLMLFGVF